MSNKFRSKSEFVVLLLEHKIDIIFILFLMFYSLFIYSYVSITFVPADDASDYLKNARAWLSNEPAPSTYRPPLISLYIAGVWMITGENWVIIEYLQPLFTLGAGIILYLTLRKHKGSIFALSVSALTLFNPTVFFWSTQIMTEGPSLFFLVLSLYFMKSHRQSRWILAGVSIGLTFASRYSILIEALVIFVIECVIRKDRKFTTRVLSGAIPTIFAFILLVYLKVGYFEGVGAPRDTHFTFLLSLFYFENSINIWGLSIVLLPLAFLFRRTYIDKYNWTFIGWFVVSLLFWSANPEPLLQSPRYLIQFTPAVYYLVILAIENVIKINTAKETVFGMLRRPSDK
jgi:4-amino-4-deoxy-L-arabinose transferase-like glycosyltransferase